jgi:hypothetical protein
MGILGPMSDEVWRPLGVDTEDAVASYDALHDGVPAWMKDSYWLWVRSALSRLATYRDGSGRFAMLDVPLAEHMCQVLRIPLADLRAEASAPIGQRQLDHIVSVLQRHPAPLQIADYLLAHKEKVDEASLEDLLTRTNSLWRVGERAGRKGLDRRLALGVQTAGDTVMARSGKAGTRLAKAWDELFGLSGSPSEAYRLAILAIEDAAIPKVSPTNSGATLGTVIKQIEDQKDWRLPMSREHARASSPELVVSLMRLVWHGQHDRHGGQPTAPGAVSPDEARVAVMAAVVIVDWFSADLVRRSSEKAATDSS